MFSKGIISEVNHLLIWEMNRKAIDIRGFLMHLELQEMPASFNRTNVSPIHILLDFIPSSNTHSSTIMALVDVLMDVLDCSDRGTNLNIDVAIVLGSQMRIIRDDPGVVEDKALGVGMGDTVVRPCILGITIFFKKSARTERFWEMLLALAIDHARSIGEVRTTGTMEHTFCDNFKEPGMSGLIRDLSRDDVVCLECIVNLEFRIEENQDVCMREATLLELYCVNTCSKTTKEATINVLDKSFQLLLEDPGNYVRTI